MLRRLLDRLRRRGTGVVPPAADPTPHDFAQEREDRQQAGLGDEDRAWQEASLQRNRDRRERDQADSSRKP
jgi:hypothetical protein